MLQGSNIAVVPGIVAGYNGHIAWGMTMVMAINQDLSWNSSRSCRKPCTTA
jgi:acyl-homoserine lactone acylase PvdQ